MAIAKQGDNVSVHYTGTLADGTQFDSSQGREPLSFEVGSSQIIPGFSQAIDGMAVGESKTVVVSSDQAYGDFNPEMVQEVPRANFPDDLELSEGLALSANGPDGQVLNFTVVSFDDEKARLDGNHPLAGKDLTFILELVSID